jgi:hypothetical protein
VGYPLWKILLNLVVYAEDFYFQKNMQVNYPILVGGLWRKTDIIALNIMTQFVFYIMLLTLPGVFSPEICNWV